MLIEFKATNFKSFGDELNFSMTKSPRLTELGYSIFKKTVGSKKLQILPTSVIYGPNASGKTNIVSAMEVLKKIILRGSINDSDEKMENASTCFLCYVPNIHEKNKPVSFEIEFMIENHLFNYKLEFSLGNIFNIDRERKILTEKLEFDNKEIFSRVENKISLSNIKYLIKNNFISSTISPTIVKALETNIISTELVLENGFKNIISSNTVILFNKFLSEKLNVIYRANNLVSFPSIAKTEKIHEKTIIINDDFKKIAKTFGEIDSIIGYHKDENGHLTLISAIKNSENQSIAIPAQAFESYGTIRFFYLFPLIVETLKEGKTLVIDEFDASIHPNVLINLISLFHNDDINIHQAQLIFNTHNPIFLNRNIFRRDEIKLVERSENKNYSQCYRLSDFGTSGPNAVKLTDNYLEKYLDYNYGGISEIDFTDLMEQLINEKK